jgi:outer membrane cobalamin receptor
MYVSKLVMIVILVACACLPAFAEPFELDPVVVTATRTARPSSAVVSSVSIITAEEIALSGARNLAEVLRGSVGLHITDSGTPGSKTSVSIRGSEAGQVLVLLDGVRLNSAQMGMFDLGNLPVAVEDIERVEILRGPASALYGSNAMGGVVQIFTRKATSEPATRLSYSEGRHDTREVSFATSGTKGDLRYQLGAAREHSNGYRDNSEFDQTTLNAAVGFTLPGGYDVNFSGYQLDKDTEIPGPTYWLTPEANQQDEVTHLALALTGPVGPLKILARPTYSRHRNDFENSDPYDPQDDRHTLETIGIELQGEMTEGRHLLVVGGDYYRDDLDSTANGEVDQDRWALFGQYEFQYSSRLAFLLGLRHDAHSDFSDETSPRAGARFNLTDSTRLRISGGKAYRAPTLNDRFWPDTGWVKGNPDLDPETSWEYEVAVDQELGQLGRITVAGFDRYVDDLIKWAPDQNWVWTPTNLTNARILGAEVNVTLRPASLLGMGLNYTYLHPQDRDTDEYIVGKLRHEVNGYIEVGPAWDAILRLDGSYYNYYEDPMRTSNDSFAVFDATLTKTLLVGATTELELTLAVKNLLDKDYEDTPGFPMPPRQWFAGVTANF